MITKPLKVAAVPGDGIGVEVMHSGVRCLTAIGAKFNIEFKFKEFHGHMFDALYLGAVGTPHLVNDEVTLWGSLLKFPHELLAGVPSPLANRRPGHNDSSIVRENTDGEYSSIGGKMFEGTDREIFVQKTVMTRVGVYRILKYAFKTAEKTPLKRLTSATKRNGISITMTWWDARVAEMARKCPNVKGEKYHIDVLTAHFVQRPEIFDVVVGASLFGDILANLGPACIGTIGITPSGNINPEGELPSLFEPVHGSVPDIAGKGIANPTGMIWAGQMLLQNFSHNDAAAALLNPVESVLARSDSKILTADIEMWFTNWDTKTLGEAIENEILAFGKSSTSEMSVSLDLSFT
ncbi:tartrate dehydrogenase [Xylariaceae sp. FL0255]|nr:tartrate dehydrogenase [Xylariaceae sp. FL0255]